MQLSKRTALGAAAIAAVAFAVPSMASSGGTPNPGSGNHFGDSSQSFVCKDSSGNQVGTVSLNGPDKLWPPNHKMIDESITALDNDSSENTSLTLAPDKVGDVAGGDGGPTHDPDIFFPNDSMTAMGTGSATVPFQLRAERSGKGDGRTYTIQWSATFGMDSCGSSDSDKGPFQISVPHDMGNK